jgi:predicted transcriptional regulator
MRTTIEISDEQRAALLEIAAARGEKGFSNLVREAIGLWLEAQARRTEAIDAALQQQGALSEGEADELEATATQLRTHWR